MGQGHALPGDKPLTTMLQVAYATMRDLLLAQLTPREVAEEVAGPVLRDAVSRVPALLEATSRLLDEFERGTSVFQLNRRRLDDRIGDFETSFARGARQLVFSMSLVGLLLASAFVLTIPLENAVSPLERLVIRHTATIGLLISAGLTVFMVLNTMWRTLWELQRRR